MECLHRCSVVPPHRWRHIINAPVSGIPVAISALACDNFRTFLYSCIETCERIWYECNKVDCILQFMVLPKIEVSGSCEQDILGKIISQGDKQYSFFNV